MLLPPMNVKITDNFINKHNIVIFYMIKPALRRIGLSQGEIKVYLALLELGSSTSGNIIKLSKVSGSKVYEVLDRLASKGLATHITKNGVKYFEATDPNNITDYLDEKEKEIEHEKIEVQKIIPQLILKHKTMKKSEAKIFIGWEGIKSANMDIINSLNKGEEWLSMGLTQQPKSYEIWFTKKQKIRAKKGIILKQLLNKKYKSLYEKRKNIPHTKFRFLPKVLEMPTSIEIYKDKVLIMILSIEDSMAIMIESKPIAESFRKYFFLVWDQMKE